MKEMSEFWKGVILIIFVGTITVLGMFFLVF